MIYKLDKFTLDTDLFELHSEQAVLHAEPQVIELIILLVENRDRMVSKEEINEQIWHGRIVSDSALSSRIKTARQLLDDNGRTQARIRTIHKKGFRYVGNVELISDTPDSSPIARSSTDSVNNVTDNKDKPAIAVLPFANLSNDTEQDYFADGISSDIINHLAKHRWLSVTARNSTFGFKGKQIDVIELGQVLGLDYVVEGSVQKAGNRVRIHVTLVDAKNGLQKWSDRYDRELSDIFSVQDEITEKMVARLEPEIGLAERHKIIQQRPTNLQAWDCYHLGIYHFFKFTAHDNSQAQSLLQQSHTLDPNFGEAHAWWAYALTLGMIYWDTEPSQALLDKALESCNIALKLDSHNASFYSLKARILLARKEYDLAIQENHKAIQLNPTFAAAHCGLGDSLAYEGEYEASLSCFKKAIELSPNDPQIWAFYSYGALAMIFKQDFELAIEWTKKALSIPNCQFWARAHQIVAYAHLNMTPEMQQASIKLMELKPNFSIEFAQQKLFYLKKQDQISSYLEGLRKAGIK